MQQPMLESTGRGRTLYQPPSNEAGSFVGGDSRSPRIIGMACNTNIPWPVDDSYRNCRPKWLAKFLKMICDRAD
jgi:hypothetical protein